MKNDFIDAEMRELQADGVDFVDLFQLSQLSQRLPKPIVSYTKEEWGSVQCYPKSGRFYWRLDDKGQKVRLGDDGHDLDLGIRHATKDGLNSWSCNDCSESEYWTLTIPATQETKD